MRQKTACFRPIFAASPIAGARSVDPYNWRFIRHLGRIIAAAGLCSLVATPTFAAVTFAADVAPILFAKCSQCHRPDGSAPFSLLTYESARSHATQIAELTRKRLMPPWKAEPSQKFVGMSPLSNREIEILAQWLQDGAPEGDRRRLPAAPRFAGAWQLGTPDLTISLPQSYTLASDGPDVSRVFVVALPVDRVRYVRGLEFRANNPRIHHANIRIDTTPASRLLDEQDPEPGYDGIILRSAVYPDGHFLGWTPGQVAPLLPKGLAWTLRPGSYLVLQLHLVPGGKPERIQPSIGLYFTDDPPEQTPVMMRLSNQRIDIPAGEADYVATDSFVLPSDVDLLAVQPHAHYRARQVTGTAVLPDGENRVLLSIPDWDLRWQHVYRYEMPIALPRGTTVKMEWRYDNSAANVRNPVNPPVRVPWGQQSLEEMGDFWLQVAAKGPKERDLVDNAFRAKWMGTDVIGLESLIQREPQRVHLRNDAAVLYMDLNRPADAARHFEAVTRINADSPAAHFNYATALSASGRLDMAVGEYERALQLRPEYAIARNNLGTALLQLGRPEEALRSFREAARIDPALGEAHLNVALVAQALGQFADAATAFRRTLELNPKWVTALAGLAMVLAAAPDANVRKPSEAIALAQRAVELTSRRDANALDVLAVAFAAAGEFERAGTIIDEAIALQPSAAITEVLRRHKAMFEQRTPYVAQ